MSESSQDSSNPAPVDAATPATPAADATPAATPAKPTEAAGYQDVTNQKGAGYDPNKPEETPAPTDAPKYKFDKTGHDEKTSQLVESFAEMNGLSEKQVEGFANFVKTIKTQSEAQKAQAAEAAKKAQFTNMQKDFETLKSHPEFSKDLEQSFMQANKVLDLAPELKIMLTEGGRHVDARAMIALKGLYGKLYGQDGTLVQGSKADQKSDIPIWDQIYGNVTK